MGFGERDAYRLELAPGAAQFAGAGRPGQSVENILAHKFGRGVDALEFGHLIEIAIVQRRQYRSKRVMRTADVDHDSIGIERLGHEGRIDDECGAMQRLRRPEHGAAERMGDHDVIANFDGEQDVSLWVGDELAKRCAAGAEDVRQLPGKIGKFHRRRKQCIEARIPEQRDGGG